MSYAPAPLLQLQTYMKGQTGLSAASLGVVGNDQHDGGYHCGWDRRRISSGRLDDYSWQESSRDWNHKTDAARAFDCGPFPRLREMSIWMVGQCIAGTPDTQDIRSIIYSPDGLRVLRWDRLNRHSGGDDSHLTHTHFSFFADAEQRNKVSAFRRFFDKNGDDDIMFVQVAGQQEVYKSDGFSREHLTSYPALQAAVAAGYQVIQVGTVADLEALAGPLRSTIPPVPGGGADAAAVRLIVRQELDATKLGNVA